MTDSKDRWQEQEEIRRKSGPLAEALSRVIKTQIKLEKAREDFDGYSFDYFHSGEIKNAENAGAELVFQIEALIDAKLVPTHK